MSEDFTKNNETMDSKIEESTEKKEIDGIVERIKDLVKKGNIAKIVIKKEEDIILNLPLNVGILGGIVGAATAPWALIVATIATIGLKCKIELITDDGDIINII